METVKLFAFIFNGCLLTWSAVALIENMWFRVTPFMVAVLILNVILLINDLAD